MQLCIQHRHGVAHRQVVGMGVVALIQVMGVRRGHLNRYLCSCVYRMCMGLIGESGGSYTGNGCAESDLRQIAM